MSIFVRSDGLGRTLNYLICLPLIALAMSLVVSAAERTFAAGESGALTIIEPDGKSAEGCPLEHTSVTADISGFVARVSVTQVFHNPRKQKIEAVYTFPLSSTGAVDDMVMKIGARVVKGVIKKREEAREIYEQAKSKGHVASLLDQERPNIFTQSVANIMPGEKVEITIQYAEILPYEAGAFKFAFPMVVGPRFIPGAPTERSGTGWAPDTAQVPDASRITPPVTPEGTRAGHDIDLTVNINAGVPISAIESRLHEVETKRDGENRATVVLANKKEVPNRDFILNYQVAGDQIRSGIITHKQGAEGYATIILIPPKRVTPAQIAPREMIFVIDCSGSQFGLPLEKAKDAMRYFIEKMGPNDTFNIIDFNVGSRQLFSEPKPNTPEYRDKALKYLATLEAKGGTWMGPAVEQIANQPAPENRLRIISFMTDGYVGNDFEIVSLVQKYRGSSRWFPFGTGNSVNRFLLEQMARVGGGEAEIIDLKRSGEEVASQFYKRIAAPALTNITLKVDGVNLTDVYPTEISDLWEQKPLVFKAKYAKAGKGRVTINGFAGGKPYQQTLDIELPEAQPANDVMASIWARAKVDDLMDKEWFNVQKGAPSENIKNQIIETALKHRIMTQFTSFVAVEEAVITQDGKPVTVTVPVEMPEGVSRERIFGPESEMRQGMMPPPRGMAMPQAAAPEKDGLRRRVGAPYLGGSPQAPVPSSAEHSVARKEGALRSDLSVQVKGKPAQGNMPAVMDEAKRDARKNTDKPSKLDASLPEILKQFRDKKQNDFSYQSIKITGGKVVVQVWLEKAEEAVLAKLKEAGLEISFTASTGKTVIGTISLDKLEKLAELNEVKFVEPVKQ